MKLKKLLVLILAAWMPVCFASVSQQNHNPLDIQYNSHVQWKGQLPLKQGERFVRFSNDAAGFRAAYLQVEHDYNLGLNTVSKLVNRLTPASENNTQKAIHDISNRMHVISDQTLTKSQIGSFVLAMAAQEGFFQK